MCEPVDPYDPGWRQPVCPGCRERSSISTDANGEVRLPSPEESDPDGDAYTLQRTNAASVLDSAPGTAHSIRAAAKPTNLIARFA